MLSLIKAYYQLTKPGIIYGNALTAAAGFFLATSINGTFSLGLFFAILAGTSLVIGSACVFNNFIDKDIDQLMARTKIRALVTGSISTKNALIFATILGVVGFILLAAFTNSLAVNIGLIGFVDYVILYGVSKRHSIYGTLIGSIAGATPIVAGYVAVTNRFDPAALILFLILVFWQMPHFYAIAIYRLDDYQSAKIPVLSITKGTKLTKIHMLLFTLAFAITVPLLTILGYTGYFYLTVMLLLSIIWLGLSLKGFRVGNEKRWARQIFLLSLIIIMALSLMLSVGAILP